MLSRRGVLESLVAAGCLAAGSRPARADKPRKLGTITPGAPLLADGPFGKVLLDALARRGYVLGQNLLFEARGGSGDPAMLPKNIEELRVWGAEALLGLGYACAVAAKAANMPTIIAWGAGDPVETGLVESWAHPGGNITGISDVAAPLTIKRLELLKMFSPGLHKVAMLWNTDNLAMTLRYRASATTAQSLGIEVLALGVREPNDFNDAFAAMDHERPEGILMVADTLTNLNRKKVFDFAMARRVPAIYEYADIIRDGGLMSYGADQRESLERAAAMVDRIFKGVRPGDLPFEQPTHYPFVLNMKVARASGFDPPLALLALADEVIE